MNGRKRKRESLIALYLGLAIALGVNIAFGYANLCAIRRERFNEVSGPGGHMVEVVTAADQPIKFWGFVVFTTLVSAAVLVLAARGVVMEHRIRRRNETTGGVK